MVHHERVFEFAMPRIILPQKSHNSKIEFDHSGPVIGARVFELEIGRLSILVSQQNEEGESLAKRDWFCI